MLDIRITSPSISYRGETNWDRVCLDAGASTCSAHIDIVWVPSGRPSTQVVHIAKRMKFCIGILLAHGSDALSPLTAGAMGDARIPNSYLRLGHRSGSVFELNCSVDQCKRLPQVLVPLCRHRRKISECPQEQQRHRRNELAYRRHLADGAPKATAPSKQLWEGTKGS
jgi:hypothetical protein